MAASGALPGCFSFVLAESEDSHSSPGSEVLQQPRLSSFRAERCGVAPCIFPSEQSIFGITGWGHMSEPRANVLRTQSAHCGDYTQSWMMNSVTTELSTVHQQYPAESSNCDFVSGSRTILGQEHLTSGAGRTDTYSSFNRTDQAGKDEEKRGLDPNNPVSNWLRGSSTRKKRCPYIKHQILEPEKTFLFNTGPRSHRETGLNLVPKPQDESKKQTNKQTNKQTEESDYTRSDLIHVKAGGLFIM